VYIQFEGRPERGSRILKSVWGRGLGGRCYMGQNHPVQNLRRCRISRSVRCLAVVSDVCYVARTLA